MLNQVFQRQKHNFIHLKQLLWKATLRKAVLFHLKRGVLTHVGQRCVSGDSARLGHCLGLHAIPTVTVVTVLTPFPSAWPC